MFRNLEFLVDGLRVKVHHPGAPDAKRSGFQHHVRGYDTGVNVAAAFLIILRFQHLPVITDQQSGGGVKMASCAAAQLIQGFLTAENKNPLGLKITG